MIFHSVIGTMIYVFFFYNHNENPDFLNKIIC